jgi:arginyl-tRNA--protein-N-Asp/Glu arginylyltransferase
MNEQLFTDGDVVELKGVKLECSFVSYQEIDGQKMNFTYSFRPHEDMERQRKETTIPEAESNTDQEG